MHDLTALFYTINSLFSVAGSFFICCDDSERSSAKHFGARGRVRRVVNFASRNAINIPPRQIQFRTTITSQPDTPVFFMDQRNFDIYSNIFFRMSFRHLKHALTP